MVFECGHARRGAEKAAKTGLARGKLPKLQRQLLLQPIIGHPIHHLPSASPASSRHTVRGGAPVIKGTSTISTQPLSSVFWAASLALGRCRHQSAALFRATLLSWPRRRNAPEHAVRKLSFPCPALCLAVNSCRPPVSFCDTGSLFIPTLVAPLALFRAPAWVLCLGLAGSLYGALWAVPWPHTSANASPSRSPSTPSSAVQPGDPNPGRPFPSLVLGSPYSYCSSGLLVCKTSSFLLNIFVQSLLVYTSLSFLHRFLPTHSFKHYIS